MTYSLTRAYAVFCGNSVVSKILIVLSKIDENRCKQTVASLP